MPHSHELSKQININSRASTHFAIALIVLAAFLRVFFMIKSNLLVEEAYYWNYAQHIDFGYLDHPPMVALLIKFSTFFFGNNELAVRFPALLCWIAVAIFSVKYTNLITKGAGIYTVLLLSILPFFFLQSLVITPDLPLMVCWVASLYFLYRALILNESLAWYSVGFWLGLGMLSKYTIALLGPAILLFVTITPSARKWFFRKEPYLAIVIAILLFSPVIYWNSIHQWASFEFQSTRRFSASYHFYFHCFVGLLLLFLTHLGLWGLWKLIRKDIPAAKLVNENTVTFILVFTFLPLITFGVFSLTHRIRFNWIGPSLLSLLPWLALLISQSTLSKRLNFRNSWLITGSVLLVAYGALLYGLSFGFSENLNKKLFRKFIAWDAMTKDINALARSIQRDSSNAPIIIPLDLYNISSELIFYQNKLLANGIIQKAYPVIGRHVFGAESLMYRYWFSGKIPPKKTVILVSFNNDDFQLPTLNGQVIDETNLKFIWARSQGKGVKIKPMYYKIVKTI